MKDWAIMLNKVHELAREAHPQLFERMAYAVSPDGQSAHISLISERSARGWAQILSDVVCELSDAELRRYLQERWPEVFGKVPDPRAEHIEALQKLGLQIAQDSATIAQRMAELTRLLKELV